MTLAIILAIAVLCALVYLIGHAHGKGTVPVVVLGGPGSGSTPSTPPAVPSDPNTNPEIKSPDV